MIVREAGPALEPSCGADRPVPGSVGVMSIDPTELDQIFTVALAVVATLCLVAGFVLMLANRRARTKAAAAVADAAGVASNVTETLADPQAAISTKVAAVELAKIDWDKVSDLLQKFPEHDRGPLVFVVVGALGWVLLALVQSWISFSVTAPTPTPTPS